MVAAPSPEIAKEASEKKEGSAVSVLDSSIAEEVERADADDFIASDVFKWRWHGDPQSSLLFSDRYFHISPIAWNSFFASISGRMGGLGSILKRAILATTSRNGISIGETAASSWLRIVPWGIRKLAVYIKEKYRNPPVVITENGMDDPNKSRIDLDEALQDDKKMDVMYVVILCGHYLTTGNGTTISLRLLLSGLKPVSPTNPSRAGEPNSQRTPFVPVSLTLDVGGQFMWVNCYTDYVSSTYRPARCRSAQCSLAKSTSYVTECPGTPKPGCNNNTCALMPDNSVNRVATIGDLGSDVVTIQLTNGTNPSRVVSVPQFLCVYASTLDGLASGVAGWKGLEELKYPCLLSYLLLLAFLGYLLYMFEWIYKLSWCRILRARTL
nr:basic 7S globulin-like [Tanacetum cinerariifolium]